MSIRDSYQAGTPCWIDLMSPDVDASTAFYTALFGWEAVDQFDDDGVRIYTNFLLDDHLVAGMGGTQPGMEDAPPVWATYIATDDVDATVAAVDEAGGQVMMPAMDVMTQGRMAIFSDPTGAVVSAWEAGDHVGATIVNDPNTWAWNELMTRDVDTALSFYGQVFGWTTEQMDMGELGTYHVIQGGDEGGLGGVMPMPPMLPDHVPNHWGVYFTVADAQAIADRATELGGTVVEEPSPSGVGIMAVIRDPQGGSFSIMQPTPDDD